MDARLQRRGHSLTPHDVSPRSFQLVAARLLTTTGNGFAGKRKKEKKRKTSRASTPSLLAFHRLLSSRIELIPSRNDFNLNRSSLSTDPYSPRQINTNIKRGAQGSREPSKVRRNVAKWEIVIGGGWFAIEPFSNSNLR